MHRIIATVLLLVSAAFLLPVVVLAKDLEITSTNEYYIEKLDEIRVVSTHRIVNNSNDTILRKDNTDTFVISHLKVNQDKLSESLASVRIVADGVELPYQAETKGEAVYLTVNFPRRVMNNDSLTITLTYTNKGLIQHYGALYDIYLPGIPGDAVLENDYQRYRYNTIVYLNEVMFPEENFTLPHPAKRNVLDSGITRMEFAETDLIGRSVWIQRGRVQYYKFRMTQEVSPTMQNNLGFRNEYALVLPRDIDNVEIYQKVSYESILPLPDKVRKDADGNLIAYFSFLSSEKAEVVVDGYVEVGLTGVKLSSDNSGSLSDYQPGMYSDALKAADFWEVDNPEIQAEAEKLLSGENNIYRLLGKTFDFVTDRIDYSEVKRLGSNERQGALATLQNGSGVCMEYSDLFLALARAAGVPTRAVFGYGFDPRESGSSQESHQWVASYIPSLDKWYDMDVTWGDSGQVAEGGNLNHFYTHMVTTGPEDIPDISIRSYGATRSLSLPEYEITAMESIPEGSYLSSDQVLDKYPAGAYSGIQDSILQIPLKISAFFTNFSDRDALSIALLTVGFTMIIVPLVLLNRKRIRFGKQQKAEVVVDNEPLHLAESANAKKV